jgi:threonine dehydrogenase-like Zn-dependent dehydrogenase
MRAAVFRGAGDVRIEDVPDPRIERPTDAIVRVSLACICGSDLWFYRGVSEWSPGWRTGHEWLGVVEAVGADVRTLRAGDTVVAPFAYSDGTCEFCQKGLQTSCLDGGYWGGEDADGGQGEAVRAPYADGTLVVVPPEVAQDAALMSAVLPLTDVLPTGHHAAVAAGVRPGSTVAVVGDGAVGLCGVLAAARLGAGRVIALGHHDDRLDIARRFGATDVVTARGDEAVDEVRAMTDGGAECVLECVGMQSAMEMSLAIARDGGTVGYVGVPNGVESIDLSSIFGRNVALRGGVAPARAYIPELLADVMAGRLDPSPVLDLEVSLDDVPRGYAAMDARESIKVKVRL